MKFLLRLAYRNLTRYWRRTIITALAIGVGLAAFIFIDSMMAGAITSSKRNLKDYETASAQIYAPQYYKERLLLPTKNLIKNPDKLMESLRQVGVDKIAPRLAINCEIINDDSGQSMILTGVNPSLDDQVFRLGETIKEGNKATLKRFKEKNKNFPDLAGKELIQGRSLKPGDEAIVLGGWLAQELGVYPGDWVTIQYHKTSIFDPVRDEWIAGYLDLIEVKVVGLIKTGNPVINRGNGYMDISTLDKMLETHGAVSSIAISLPNGKKEKAQLREIKQVVANYFDYSVEKVDELNLVKTWEDLGASFLAVAAADQGGSVMILILVIIIAAVGISNTMMMSVVERRREIGMMRALGMSRKLILINFMLESAGVGFIGSILGLLMGLVLDVWLIYDGIDFGFMMREFDIGYRIADVFKGTWRFDMIITGMIVTVIFSSLFAIFPVYKELRKEIPESLRV